MISKLKAGLGLAILTLGWALPAAAAMDVDNSEGRYNGHYKCTLTIKRPKVDPEEYQTSLELDGKFVVIHTKEADVRTHYDTMVDYSYKTEIDAHDPKDSKVRYRIKIEGNIVP